MEDVAYDDDIVHDAGTADADYVPQDVVENVCRGDDVNRDTILLNKFHKVHSQGMEALDCGDALHRNAGRELNAIDNDEFKSNTVDELKKLYGEVLVL